MKSTHLHRSALHSMRYFAKIVESFLMSVSFTYTARFLVAKLCLDLYRQHFIIRSLQVLWIAAITCTACTGI